MMFVWFSSISCAIPPQLPIFQSVFSLISAWHLLTFSKILVLTQGPCTFSLPPQDYPSLSQSTGHQSSRLLILVSRPQILSMTLPREKLFYNSAIVRP